MFKVLNYIALGALAIIVFYCAIVFYMVIGLFEYQSSYTHHTSWFMQEAYADGIFFAPYDSVKTQIINLISGAKTSIRVCCFAINDPDIVNALIASKQKGIDVQIILDHSQSSMSNEAKVIKLLKQANIPLYIGKSLKHNLVHSKYIVTDGNITEEGSYNFTIQAANQDNTAIIYTDTTIAKKFLDNWDRVKGDLK